MEATLEGVGPLPSRASAEFLHTGRRGRGGFGASREEALRLGCSDLRKASAGTHAHTHTHTHIHTASSRYLCNHLCNLTGLISALRHDRKPTRSSALAPQLPPPRPRAPQLGGGRLLGPSGAHPPPPRFHTPPLHKLSTSLNCPAFQNSFSGPFFSICMLAACCLRWGIYKTSCSGLRWSLGL